MAAVVYSTMITDLVFTLIALELQQPIEQQFQRQQQQLEQIQQQLRQNQQQMGRLQDLLERQEKQRDPQRPPCSAELRWVSNPDQRRVPGSTTAVVPLNLFSLISKPTEVCLPAEIRVTASYLDAAENLICSGVIENVAIQRTLTQSINLDIRPWNLREFARWRNEPPQVNSGAKMLVCLNPEGVSEATSDELARVTSLRVRATVLPAGGAMSTAEVRLNLSR